MFCMSQEQLNVLIKERDFQAAAGGNLRPSEVAPVQRQDHVVIQMEPIERPVSLIRDPQHREAYSKEDSNGSG